MKTLFKTDQKVKWKNKEVTVKGASKNFVTNEVVYCLKLEKGEIRVKENELLSAQLTKEENQKQKELKTLCDKYKELINKSVPNNKRQDVEWIASKIKEAEENPNILTYSDLEKLDRDGLENLAAEQGLDELFEVGIDEYDDTELLEEIATELDIEIPKN